MIDPQGGRMRIRAIPMMLRLSAQGHTDGVVNSVSKAWDLAASRGHGSISPEYMLAGIVKAGERRLHTILHRMGFRIDPSAVCELTDRPQSALSGGWLRFDQATVDLLSAARREARGMGHRYIGTEHLILAMLLEPSRPVSDYLRGQQIDAEAVRLALNDPAQHS
jgi:ATP-dependent Clp protease ATP-binding subunit ClpC